MTASHVSAKVVARKDFTDDLFCLWLKPETEEGKKFDFKFKPGQYCTIGLKGIERAYSIVSAPHESLIELFIELVPTPNGHLTPLLYELTVGDSVLLRPRAKGIFTFDPKYKNHVMVATVTGIVPYISIIRDYTHRKNSGHKFFVLQGASYFDEFVYNGELNRIVRSSDLGIDFQYVSTVSRPNEQRNSAWVEAGGRYGRVNEILEYYLSMWDLKYNLRQDNTLIYACGHPGMIEDVKARLLPKAWKIKEERFWKE